MTPEMFHTFDQNTVVDSIQCLVEHTNATFIYKTNSRVNKRISFYRNCEVKPFFFYVPFFNGKILRDCDGANNETRINLNVTRQPKPSVLISDPVFYLDESWAGNFHHWFWDCAPKFIQFITLKKHIPNLKLLINLKILTQNELRQLLGSYADDVIYMDPYLEQTYQCEQFYIANPTECQTLHDEYFYDQIHIDMFKLFIDAFYDENFTWDHKKIYISRYGACLTPNGTRKILNILETHKFFEQLEYKPIFTEQLGFYEKINIFQRATHICCEHGSGANHLFFTKEDVKMGIINHPFLNFNEQWLKYSDFNRTIVQFDDIGCYMDDRFICKYPEIQHINYKIQNVSKAWCLDLYKLEAELAHHNFI
jgi:hypothetical protein